jgi:two-component system sensor histidine kinase AtoS
MLEVRTMPQFRDNERMIGLIHIMRDITERKRVEASLQRAEQMKLVGEWATSLAHEIKNPLAGIKLSIEALLENRQLSADDREIVFKAVDEIKRIQTLLKNILNFARPPKPQFIITDINDLLEKTVNFSLRHPSLTARSPLLLDVSKDFDPRVPEMWIDPMQVQQIVMNLIFNAIEAMPEGGRLSVSSSYQATDKTVTIDISDTGTGIDATVVDDIFKPFFTTKKKGSGLGLAITKRLVEHNHGRISLESQAGRGTTFRVVFSLRGTRNLSYEKSKEDIPAG